MKEATHTRSGNENGLCLIRNDYFFRVQHKLKLMPNKGLGFARRALFWAMLSWLPLILWAGFTGHISLNGDHESVLQHFGVHVRALVAIPLFILAESLLHTTTTRLIPYFATSGLVPKEELPHFQSILMEIKRLRDSALPWIVIIGIILSRFTYPMDSVEMHELAWVANASAIQAADYGFGGWWFLYVTRTVFMVLALAWFWRLMLLGILFHRITRLPLLLVPSHPDRLGGLGFIEELPLSFTPVIFALSSVSAAKWAHEVIYHQQSVVELKMLMIGFVAAALLLFMAPYLAFSRVLQDTKKQALLDYGKLVGDHGRLVHRRWIQEESIGEQHLLDAPEIGPVADTAAIYEAVAAMRSSPIGKKILITLALPAIAPMVVLLSLQIPIKDVLITLVKTLA